MTELAQLVAIATITTPIASAFVQIYKTQGLSGKILPWLAIATGVIINLAWALTFKHVDLIAEYALAGVLSGLSSTGLYELIKPENKKESK